MRSTDAEVPAARSHIVKLLQKQMEERKAFWSSRHPDVIPFDQSFSQHRAQLIRKVPTDYIIIRLPVVLQRILSTIDTFITFLRTQRAIEILQQIMPATALVLQSLFDRDSSTALHLEVSLPLGKIPLGVMILGIGCLLASVICFAVDSQPRTIWTSCVVITSITIFYSSVGALVMMTLRYENDNGDLFRRLNAASRQLWWQNLWILGYCRNVNYALIADMALLYGFDNYLIYTWIVTPIYFVWQGATPGSDTQCSDLQRFVMYRIKFSRYAGRYNVQQSATCYVHRKLVRLHTDPSYSYINQSHQCSDLQQTI